MHTRSGWVEDIMIIDMCIENVSRCKNIPDESAIHQWVTTALSGHKHPMELNIRIIDEDESAALNHQYRKKNNPTNVLSFPANLPESLKLPLLGDLAVCAQVIEREAREQNKALYAHWAHIIIHGSLHLIGFDHKDDAEAEKMELLETQLLVSLNFLPPYE